MSDRWTVAIALLVVVSALLAPAVSVAAAALVVVVAVLLPRPFAPAQPIVLGVGLCLLVGGRSHGSLAELAQPLSARVAGVAQLVSDPEPARFGTQVIVRIDDRRYVATAGFQDAGAVRTLLSGDLVAVSGRPSPLEGAPIGWVRSRHLAGRLALSEVRAVPGTAPWYRLANVVHRTLSAGAESLGDTRAELYTGLVMGDDRGQSELMQFRFQAAGLSHLLAVSGQNVAFLLAVAAPLLQRMGPRTRVAVGVALLTLFTLVTRAEPSVLRAAVMAAIALAAVTTGRVVSGLRVLSLTIIILVVVDPLLVYSIGFRLSVAATAGLLLMSRPLAERLPGPSWFRLPLAVTLAAQASTAPVLISFTGGLPAAATPANLLAVPAAGVVMMLGVSVGAIAGLVREPVAQILQLPVGVLVGWIERVATVASTSPLPMLGPLRLALLMVAALLVAAHRRWPSERLSTFALVVSTVCAVVALWPLTIAGGRYEPVDGASLWVGGCGGQVVTLGPISDQGGLLEWLWSHGVRHIDVVVVDGSSTATRAALVLDEQFVVRRIVTTASRASPGVELMGADTLSVGGLRVATRTGSGPRAVAWVSERPCNF